MSTPGNSPASADVWTVRRILEWTAGFLKQKGVESPRLEAELLLAHARQCQRIRLYTDIDNELTDAERTQMRASVQRRARSVNRSLTLSARVNFTVVVLKSDRVC